MLSVVRQTMIDHIAQNPHTIISPIRPTTTNDYGVTVPDLTQAPVDTTLGVGRITRRRLPDPLVTGSKTPYDFQDLNYLLVDYESTWLRKGIEFSYFDERYRTRYPEKRIMFGAIAYITCSLEQITSVDAGEPV